MTEAFAHHFGVDSLVEQLGRMGVAEIVQPARIRREGRGVLLGIVSLGAMDVPVDTKTCPRCGRTLPASEFQSGTLNVPSDECTDCVWERMCAVPQADFAGQDTTSNGSNARGAMYPGELRRVVRRYRGGDPYKTLERLRSRLAAGSVCRSVSRGLLARAESGYVGFAAQLRRRRTLRHAAGGWHTSEDVRRLYDEQDGRCFYCGAQLNARYEVDHKTPLSRGGSDWPDNLCCVCDYCASHKQSRTADEFRVYLAGLRRRRS